MTDSSAILTRIDALAFGGEGVGTLPSGKRVFVPLTAPGDRVRLVVVEERDRIARGRILELIEPGEARVPMPCPHALVCGGCQLQQVSAAGQLAAKEASFYEALARTGGVPRDAIPDAGAIVPSPALFRYRSRCRLHAEGATLGYRERRGKELVAIETCPLLSPALEAIALSLIEDHRTDPIPGLVDLDLSVGADGAGSAAFHLSSPAGKRAVRRVETILGALPAPRADPRGTGTRSRKQDPKGEPNQSGRSRCDARAHPSAGLSGGPMSGRKAAPTPDHCARSALPPRPGPGFSGPARPDTSGPALRGALLLAPGQPPRVFGDPVIRRPAPLAAGVELFSRADLFAQANTAANERLVEVALGLLAPGPTDEAIELYSGAGNFTFALAQQLAHVTAVEEAGPSLELARRSATAAGAALAGKVRFVAGDAVKVARGLAAEGKRFDLALLDPPRQGAKELPAALAALGPKRIVYVSCDPLTLARDVKALLPRYRVAAARPVDMFPQTYHVEGVVLLERVD